MLVGGLRALFLQTMHPLAMAGVADHSNFREDAMGRLARTSAYVGLTTYGSRSQAEQAIAHVRRVHQQVVGTAPDGRAYAANDPHLLTWVHHTLVDSFLRSYRRYGGRALSRADADRYVDEMAVMCELWHAEPAARSVAELRAYFTDMRPELHATTAARRTSAVARPRSGTATGACALRGHRAGGRRSAPRLRSSRPRHPDAPGVRATRRSSRRVRADPYARLVHGRAPRRGRTCRLTQVDRIVSRLPAAAAIASMSSASDVTTTSPRRSAPSTTATSTTSA